MSNPPVHPWLWLLATMFLLAGCSSGKAPPVTEQPVELDYDLAFNLPSQLIDYQSQVKPILERRCVVCHGCYDAPCQLKLTSREGIGRGANPTLVYDGERILGIEPTRLFIDANTDAQWRKKGFHPIVDESGTTLPQDRLKNSVMYHLLRLKQRYPQPRVGRLPDDFTLGLYREQTCPTLEDVDDYKKEHPLWGMPYGMPNLEDTEYRTLVQWLAQGAPGPRPAEPSPEAKAQIPVWETFLNQSSNKERLVSRYLYEHLFNAHIHFSGAPPREFYRLVRSFTPPGEPVDEIPTVRPFDDPGPAPFYYRLQHYHPSIVAKDHVVYELSKAKLDRFKQLFLEPPYQVKSLPGYSPKVASNPFKTFRDIPPASRYRFLLDDAHFFIEDFIKGPVCRGQIALSVIEDHFWVFFINPEKHRFGLDPEFLEANANYLQMPDGERDSFNMFSVWTEYAGLHRKYLLAKQQVFESVHAVDLNHALSYLWDGDGKNPNAALTIFRHFDSASVLPGLHGDYPETAWIIDYPLFEKIHYLLVAGFNVFGNVTHLMNTRLYMDFLRMEGEDQFLLFLPADKRKQIRDSWYVGLRALVKQEMDVPTAWMEIESVVGYQTDDPQRELYRLIERHLGPMAGPPDPLNRCEPSSISDCQANETTAAKAKVNLAMLRIAAIRGLQLDVFPDLALVRVRMEPPEEDLLYTLVRNKAYLNIMSTIDEDSPRDPTNDTLTVLDRFTGTYPNFFFVVDISEINNFTDRYTSIQSAKDYERFVSTYGVRRTSSRFWQEADWFQERYLETEPILSGILDLNRYHNR